MFIYGIQNTITGKWYVGKTIKDYKVRFKEHRTALKGNRHTNNHLQNAYNKDGLDAFKFVPLGLARHEIELNELEKCFIAFYNSFNDGYNLTTGGDGGWQHAPETKNKISNSLKGNTFAKGSKWSNERKIEASNRMKEQIITDATRQKISNKKKSYWKNNGTLIISGINNPFFGKKHSDETIKNLRAVKLGKSFKQRVETCSVCHKKGGIGNIKRYHNSNCKFNPSNIGETNVL